MKNNYKNLKTGDIIVITDMMNQTLVSIYKGIRKSPTEKTVVTDFCSCTVDEDSLPDVFFIRDDEDITGWIEELNFVSMADEKQKAYLYRNVLDIYCDDHRDWDKYFTDSTYDEIRDWFAYKCDVEFDDNDGYPDFICDFTNFAWDILCKQMNPDNPVNVKHELTGEEIVLGWLRKIERMAGEKTTEVGFVMDDKTALNEIRNLARDAGEFVQRYMDIRMDL